MKGWLMSDPSKIGHTPTETKTVMAEDSPALDREDYDDTGEGILRYQRENVSTLKRNKSKRF
ncbi:MAG: hypothetical protein OXF02_07235 [Simkaniaceae bacterium]|nr:hypothetical protein [Simkaniaceae bacterium]